MKRLLIFLLPACMLVSGGCSEEQDLLAEQRQKLVSYLESTHSPRLIPESEVGEDEQLAFYSVEGGNSVYRYIDGYYDPERPSRAEVTPTSKVTIVFRAYVFSYSNITDSTFPFWSNDAALKSAYEELGLTVEDGAWSFEPLTVEMNGGILKGIYYALLGCREKDYVEAYMTYDVAFGDKNFSTIPRESPIALFFTVQSVE